jgi:hypothetical protein
MSLGRWLRRHKFCIGIFALGAACVSPAVRLAAASPGSLVASIWPCLLRFVPLSRMPCYAK